MKGWQVALLCVAVAALAVLVTLLFIRETEERAPQQDIPRYTADQVIAVAKAYLGERCADAPLGHEKWTTVYLGNGQWRVTRLCSRQEGAGPLPWSGYSGESTFESDWTFNEATGELEPWL